MIKYSCRDCGREFSYEEGKKIRFCPDCDRTLQETHVYEPEPPNNPKGRKRLTPEAAQINKLWPIYLESSIAVTAKFRFPTVAEWVRIRNAAYSEYRKKFSPDKLTNLEVLRDNFHAWLMFRNNRSWTTFQRTGSKALKNPQKLADLLLYLQNENIDIATRIRGALQGSKKIDGVGDGIVTALLHTFNNEEYGVWNSRTNDTLKKLHQPVFADYDLGRAYKSVNGILHHLAEETNSDLTTLDGFMWFVSKNYEFL